MKRAIFWDRDGVINKPLIREEKPHSPHNLQELEIHEGVEKVLGFSRENNFLNIVVTNQPDIKRGFLRTGDLEKMHDYIQEELAIDAVYACMHDDDDNCDCRKPKPGLLRQAAEKWNIDFKQSYIVGDQWRDVGAGQKAGCKTILLDYPYNKDVESDYRVKDFIQLEKLINNLTLEKT